MHDTAQQRNHRQEDQETENHKLVSRNKHYKERKSSSTSPHDINCRHLKHLGQKATIYLTRIQQQSQQESNPHIWKMFKIILIPKHDKTLQKGKSYRLVTLLCNSQIILPRILDDLRNYGHQDGFNTKHFTVTALQTIQLPQ